MGNVTKPIAFLVCALCAFVLLSCGGGGGGGGGVAAASSSGPWGGKTTITIPFGGGGSRASVSDGFKKLGCTSIDLTVTQTANGKSEVIYEETISPDEDVTIEVTTGSKIEATATLTIEGAESRIATGSIDRVAIGKNTLTLYVEYTYKLGEVYDGDFIERESGPYTSRDGLVIPTVFYNGDTWSIVKQFVDTDTGKSYPPGRRHDITGDVTLKDDSPLYFYDNAEDGIYKVSYTTGATLTEVTIPANPAGYKIYGIWDSAFESNSSIQRVTIENGIETIGESAFDSCSALQSVTIPNSVTSIGDSAFCNTGITAVNIPSNLTILGDFAFADCTSLRGTVTIPGGVTAIGRGSFYGANITGIVIEQGVQSIGSEAFVDCDSLQSITIPGSVTSIGQYAFSDCGILAEVRMPVCDGETMNGFGSIFTNSNNLRDIYFTTPVPCFVDSTAILGIMDEITIHVPEAGRAYESDWNSYFYGYKEIVYY